MNWDNKINVLIAAAGKGTRANLPYPKTLYKINGKEILARILDNLGDFDKNPTIIVSPNGEKNIRDFLNKNSRKANIVIQEYPKGMGDAVLSFEKSSFSSSCKNILLIWGDIPFIRKVTIQKLIRNHFENNNTFTFISSDTEKAYTRVLRNKRDDVIDIIETREENIPIKKGERDIGVFIFSKDEVFNLLKLDLPRKYSLKSKEHGFLYVVNHLAKKGFKIEGMKIAKKEELISLNKISDLDH